ncbi:hypothetical protein TUM19329_22740 [Legionella antarctica]|uniref:Uncharacterized protein n=1 Tax=Legionella antarctica TaxID=2708020 RepID=A0A6F8T6S6_9GAMM|nr:hypothetical protein TUM19329_22740 [Legionella antarctica]
MKLAGNCFNVLANSKSIRTLSSGKGITLTDISELSLENATPILALIIKIAMNVLNL